MSPPLSPDCSIGAQGECQHHSDSRAAAWTKTPPWRRRLLERRWWGAHRMSCPEQGSHGDPHAPTQLSLQGVCTCVCVCACVCISVHVCLCLWVGVCNCALICMHACVPARCVSVHTCVCVCMGMHECVYVFHGKGLRVDALSARRSRERSPGHLDDKSWACSLCTTSCPQRGEK